MWKAYLTDWTIDECSSFPTELKGVNHVSCRVVLPVGQEEGIDMLLQYLIYESGVSIKR